MTPEVRQVELEEFEGFSDMRRTPTTSWSQFPNKNKVHHLIRFSYLAKKLGVYSEPRILSGAEALERHRERLAAAQTPPLS